MDSRRYIVAIDRSSCCGLEVFGVAATPIDAQGVLVRYSDFFKHMRKLGSQKRMYVPKMLRVINKLMGERVITGLMISTRLDSAVEAVYRRESAIIACVVDDNTYQYHTTSGSKTRSYLKNIPLVLLESTLKKPGKELIEEVHRAGLTMVFLRTVMKISDIIANYTRSVLGEQLRRIPQVWRL